MVSNVAFIYKDEFAFRITASQCLESCIAESSRLYITYGGITKLCLETDGFHAVIADNGIKSGNRTSRFEK